VASTELWQRMLTDEEEFSYDQDNCAASKGNKDEAADSGVGPPDEAADGRRATAGLPPGRPCGSAIAARRRGIAFLRVELVEASRALATRVASVCGARCRRPIVRNVEFPMIELQRSAAAID
jgi:hypothetical protein